MYCSTIDLSLYVLRHPGRFEVKENICSTVREAAPFIFFFFFPGDRWRLPVFFLIVLYFLPVGFGKLREELYRFQWAEELKRSSMQTPEVTGDSASVTEWLPSSNMVLRTLDFKSDFGTGPLSSPPEYCDFSLTPARSTSDRSEFESDGMVILAVMIGREEIG